MTDREWLRAAGTSPAAIAHHYDLSDEFFALWLGPDLVYSCALWAPGRPLDALRRAQRRKLDCLRRAPRRAGAAPCSTSAAAGARCSTVRAPRTARRARRRAHAEPRAGALARAAGVPGRRFRLRELGRTTARTRRTTRSPASRRPSISHRTRSTRTRRSRSTARSSTAAPRGSARRPAGAAADLPRQRRPRGEPCRAGRRVGADPRRHLSRVDAGVALRAGAWLGDAFRARAVPRSPRALRPHVPGLGAWRTATPTRGPALLVGDAKRRAPSPATSRPARGLFRLREHALYRVVLKKRPQPKVWAGASCRPRDLGATTISRASAPRRGRLAGRGAVPLRRLERLLRGCGSGRR